LENGESLKEKRMLSGVVLNTDYFVPKPCERKSLFVGNKFSSS